MNARNLLFFIVLGIIAIFVSSLITPLLGLGQLNVQALSIPFIVFLVLFYVLYKKFAS